MAHSKKKKRKKHRGLRTFLWIQLILILLVIGGLAYYYLSGYAKEVNSLHSEAIELVQNSTADTFRRNQTTIFYDSDGTVISEMNNGEDRYYLSSDEIPQYAKDAAVSIEDKKFYQHHGVDYRAILRAVWAMLRNGKVTQGASTITQQLARNVFLNQDKTWQRKIEEIYIAVELEKKYTKNEILEFYLNNIYFANGCYGLEAASRGYFSQNAEDLSVSQIAFLIAIPNRPTYYDPLLHIDHTIGRRNLVLENMLEDQKISRDTYDQAVSETITLNPSTKAYNNYPGSFASWSATEVLMELDGFTFQTDFSSEEEKKEYQEKYNESYEAAQRKLVSGGYRVYTSLNLNIQAELQKDIDETLQGNQETDGTGVYALQGAAVCIDNTTGLVRAAVGGRSQDLNGYTLNRAFQSYRQPGSAIKPLIVYTPALENGYTADSVLEDTPVEDGPSNADGRYLGRISLRTAVALSRNTTAWKLFEEITPEKGLSYLLKMGFQRISSKDYVPAASLGGLTEGVSPLEMARGYGTLFYDGNMRNSGCITEITTADGSVVYQAKQDAVEIYQKDAARQMTDILTSVFSEGTARGYALSGMPCAGKTGTTNENHDGWFVGYTPYYTTSVWVGYDQPKALDDLSRSRQPLTIWHDFMEAIHQNLRPVEFKK